MNYQAQEYEQKYELSDKSKFNFVIFFYLFKIFFFVFFLKKNINLILE